MIAKIQLNPQKLAILKQKSFSPPYCPNPKCNHHRHPKGRFYVKNGMVITHKFPYKNQKYYCKSCGQQFSYNFFGLDYRKKRTGLFEEIYVCKTNGMSNNSIARKLKINERNIRSRILEMKRQAFLKKKLLEQNHRSSESMVYDGFESFFYSQFDPCYINTAIGKQSHYTYFVTFSPLNRKGQMKDWQKRKNAQIQKKYGRYPSNSIRVQTTYILNKLLDISPSKMLKLHTDGHQSYFSSLNRDYFWGTIDHHVTSSKQKRDASNPLFAVNNLHQNFRHFAANHRRETIAFNKNEAGLMAVAFLIVIDKNFMRPQSLKMCSYNKKKNETSPAMAIGLTEKILTFNEFFDCRRTSYQFEMDLVEKEFFFDTWKHARRKVNRYHGI